MRVLRTDATRRHAEGRAGRRIYDDAVGDALVVLWEASDRICGKRLKALMPTLVEAMERHGHLKLGPDLRTGLLAMSAATVDRSLRKVREQDGGAVVGAHEHPGAHVLGLDDPAPGFAEADLVAHSGPVTRGSFVQTLVVTDIATGWIECAPVLYREQTLLREVPGEVRKLMPFELLGFDTDNDTVFINETLRDYCRDAEIVFTRCRPWRKNDQAFVEQKNGAVVRRIVGYRRLEGLEAAAALSRLYATTRLYVNFFQPSFKLESKRRDGARVSKRYHAPATRASGSSPTRGRLPPCANASPNWPPRWTRSGFFGRCGRISSASSTSPTGRSRSRRTRPSLRSSSSSPACAPPGRKEKRGRRPGRLRNRSAGGGGRIRWSRSRNSCMRGSKPSRGAPATSCSSASRRRIRASTRTAFCAPCSGGSRAGAGKRRQRWCSANCRSWSPSPTWNRAVEPGSRGRERRGSCRVKALARLLRCATALRVTRQDPRRGGW